MRTSNLLTRFFLVAFGLCWLITIPIAMQVQGMIRMHILLAPVQWLIGFAPLLAAAWVTYGSDQREQWLAGALRVRVPARWYTFAAVLPWAILAIALAGYALTGQPPPRVRFDASTAVFAVVWLVLGYGEEVGWRALALPQLLRIRGFWAGATILGVLWCVWHYPKLFASPYLHFDANGMRLVAQFSVQILVANYLLCWLFVRTKSAVVAAVFHASWNLVASTYALAATDPLITLTLAFVTALVLYLDRARLGALGTSRHSAEKLSSGRPIGLTRSAERKGDTIYGFWNLKGYWREGRAQAEALLARPEAAAPSRAHLHPRVTARHDRPDLLDHQNDDRVVRAGACRSG